MAGKYSPIFEKSCQENKYIVIGILYDGIICSKSGNYIEIQIRNGRSQVSRDMFGSIPIYYSRKKKIISTCINHIIQDSELSVSDLHAYIQSGIIGSKHTGYQDIKKLLPNEELVLEEGNLSVNQITNYFPGITSAYEDVVLKDIIQKFTDNLPNIRKDNGKRLLHTSGGNDSTLILSLLSKMKNDHQQTLCSSFGHTDWRSDLDDLSWAKYVVGKTNFDFVGIELNKENFYFQHKSLIANCSCLLHTYSGAFYSLINSLPQEADVEYIINGSGPDECMIGTEKESIERIKSINLKNNELEDMVALLKTNRDYLKLPSSYVRSIFNQERYEINDPIRELASISFSKDASYANNQRKFHSLFILQDHIHTITASSKFIPVFFPFLTNDFFMFAFGSEYQWLNKNNIYKYQIKKTLSEFVDRKVIYRNKVAFQSPSRAYFAPGSLFYHKLQSMVKNEASRFNRKNLDLALKERLVNNYSDKIRYDFLEWNIYNILLIDACKSTN